MASLMRKGSNDVLLLALVGSLGAILLVPYVFSDGLGYDAPMHMSKAAVLARSLPHYPNWVFLWRLGQPFDRFYPPLAHIAVALVGKTIGSIIVAYKVASVATAIMLGFSFYALARCLGLRPWVASLAALGFLSAPSTLAMFYVYGQLPTALGLGFSLLALTYGLRMLNHPDHSGHSAVVAGFWLGLTALTQHICVIFAGASFALFLLVHLLGRKQVTLGRGRLVGRAALLGGVAFGVGGYALVPFLLSAALNEGSITRWLSTLSIFTLRAELFIQPSDGYYERVFWLGWPLVLGLPIGLLVFTIDRSVRSPAIFGCLVSAFFSYAPLALNLLRFLPWPIPPERYTYFGTAFGVLFTAGVVGMNALLVRSRPIILSLLLVAVCTVMVVSAFESVRYLVENNPFRGHGKRAAELAEELGRLGLSRTRILVADPFMTYWLNVFSDQPQLGSPFPEATVVRPELTVVPLSAKVVWHSGGDGIQVLGRPMELWRRIQVQYAVVPSASLESNGREVSEVASPLKVIGLLKPRSTEYAVEYAVVQLFSDTPELQIEQFGDAVDGVVVVLTRDVAGENRPGQKLPLPLAFSRGIEVRNAGKMLDVWKSADGLVELDVSQVDRNLPLHVLYHRTVDQYLGAGISAVTISAVLRWWVHARGRRPSQSH